MGLFPLVIKKRIKKLIIANNKVWEIPLPEPKLKIKNGLSIISGNIDPIINASLLNSNLFLIWGISKTSRGIAMWNNRKIKLSSLKIHIEIW